MNRLLVARLRTLRIEAAVEQDYWMSLDRSRWSEQEVADVENFINDLKMLGRDIGSVLSE
jgi:hypothetical protein